MTQKSSPYLVTVSDESRDADIHVSQSAARNTGPILDVLSKLAPQSGKALEVASGTGQHIVAFARAFSGIDWTPSDPAPEARASVAARRRAEAIANLAAPLDLDLTWRDWHDLAPQPLDVLIAINVIHISPWAATLGLMAGAGEALAPGGLLYTYGPYTRGGSHVSESNVAFDRSLRSRNPAWGIRDVDEVADAAEAKGLTLAENFEMPANNLSLAFRKGGSRDAS